MKTLSILALLSAAALLTAGCSRHDSTAAATPDLPTAQVRLVEVESREVLITTEITGTVRPVRRATIAARVMGTITEMPVMLGQSVTRGNVLLRLTAAEISERVLQAKSQLNQAQRDLTRERALLAQNASTSDMVKGLEDRVAMTEAMVREAEVMLGYTTITAPFDGVIARKQANVGDLAAPGTPLLELEGADAFEVQLGIPDSLAYHLEPGAELGVAVPAANLSFTGRLTELSSAADVSAHSVPARITVPAGTKVRSGQFARVQVPGAPAPMLLGPASALTTLGQMHRVFVAVDQRAVLRLVKPGANHGDQIEILSGLAAGDLVVVDPPATLREGSPLESGEVQP